MIKQVWEYEDWSHLPLSEMRAAFWDQIRARQLPTLGDTPVRELMAMSLAGDPSPVGIYILTEGDRIRYLGKTHGRSLAERMITHLDSRVPDGSGWSMSCCAAALAAATGCTRHAAVAQMLDWRMLWLRVPAAPSGRKLTDHIAIIENRLKWAGCLDPDLVSARDRVRPTFRVGNHRETRSLTTLTAA
jgi:hypothetical protein